MIEIDKNVPMPVTSGNAAKFPWSKMQPGDSFFAPGYDLNRNKAIAGGIKYLNTGGGCKACPGSKWTARTTVENGVSGVRVWRVS